MFNLHSAEARTTHNGFILGPQPECARGRARRCPPAAARPNPYAGWSRPRQLRPVLTYVALGLASLLATAADAPALNPPAGSAKGLDSATVARQVGGLEPGASLAVSPMPRAAATDNPGTNILSAGSGRNLSELDDKQKLAAGDRVTFRVVEDQEQPRALTVTDAGELDVPELGFVAAVGKTCKQLALEIKPKLEETTYYHATVIIGIELLNKTMSGRRVYVAGEVPRPGPQEILGGETWTVTKAIMRAGGFTQYADKKGVRLVRAGAKGTPGKSFTVNVVEVWEKARTELDLTVEPEDVIYVPTRAVNF